MDYYPYGKRINTAAATAPAQEDRHTFSGKEELAMTPAGVPYLDFGARFYSPGTGRWLSIDPMAEKYYGIGTHVYCAGNPVYYLDPDGRKLYFAEGSSDEFKQRFRQTVEFMNKCGTSYNIHNIEQSDTIYYIAERTYESSGFDTGLKTIFWDSHAVVKNKTTGILRSPTTSLAHEFGHANQFDKALHNGNLDKFHESIKTVNDNAYGSIEEARNIETTEQYAARRHGEIREDTITRFDHESSPFKVIDAYSMTPEELSKYLFEFFNYQAL